MYAVKMSDFDLTFKCQYVSIHKNLPSLFYFFKHINDKNPLRLRESQYEVFIIMDIFRKYI